MQSNVAIRNHHYHGTNPGMSSWPDEVLVNWVSDRRTNWNSAFSILAERYRSWIFRRCIFRLGNHHDAEDATHDVVMRAYANLHQIQDASKFKAWLNTIINNYCNTFAVRRSQYVNIDNMNQAIKLQDEENIIDPYAVLAEEQMVHNALSSLPVNARQVLSLRFFAEYSLEEIANALCLTLSAAKARLYRALELLKQTYNKLEEGVLTTKQPDPGFELHKQPDSKSPDGFFR